MSEKEVENVQFYLPKCVPRSRDLSIDPCPEAFRRVFEITLVPVLVGTH